MALIEYVKNSTARQNLPKEELDDFDKQVIDEVLNFHKTLPNYKPTPLVDLKNLAKYLGIKDIYIKDESKRFGLNAFKVLGGSYAIGKYISKKLGMEISDLSYTRMISDEIKQKLGDVTFITATDGNHGRGVAWIANKLKQKSVILMPKGSTNMRLENIKKEGADVTITDMNYDDAVRCANKKADENGWVMVQDTAWDGYEEVPLWIMQGYSTIMSEILTQIKEGSLEKPTHIFLQAGVGSFAGAMQGLISKIYDNDNRPITVICEPNGANCIYKSFKANDGKPHNVSGNLVTIMAGLSCGEPNTISYDILKDYSDFSISCDDSLSAHGMRVLSNPINGDERVISGESGAVGLGVISTILSNKEKYESLAKELKLDENSIVLCISTEGDTDIESYRDIVWNGSYQNKD